MKTLLLIEISLFVIFVSFKGSECILSGKTATDGFLYAVAFTERTGNKHPHCGGAIISKNCILTSALCTEWITEKKLSIHYGSIYLDRGSEVDVKEVIPHPDYNSKLKSNDIAKVVPTSDIIFSDKVQPVNLPTSDHSSQGGIQANISGWGQTHVSNYICRF